MKWFRMIGLTFLLLSIGVMGASAQVNVASLMVDSSPTKSVKDLVNQASLIVLGRPDSADETYPTNKTVEEYKIVNYVQTLHSKKNLKGTAPRLIRLLTTGTETLPPTTSPLNKLYPGPLAEGDYICFLKKVPGTELYTIIGGWQGVYPMLDGKSIALRGFGYPDFNALTLEQFEQKLQTTTR